MILKTLFSLPVIILAGGTQFFIPFLIIEIPFLKNTKETWKLNYYSTLYLILVAITHEIYLYFAIFNAVLRN